MRPSRSELPVVLPCVLGGAQRARVVGRSAERPRRAASGAGLSRCDYCQAVVRAGGVQLAVVREDRGDVAVGVEFDHEQLARPPALKSARASTIA